MLTSRYLNNALSSIHERALRLIYNDYKLSFDRILEDNKQKSIHKKILGHCLLKSKNSKQVEHHRPWVTYLSPGKRIITLENFKH